MPIYRNILDLEKSQYLIDFFDALHPFVVIDRLKAVDDYLLQASIVANTPGGPVLDVYFYEDHTDILDTLHKCIRQMLTAPGSGATITLPDGTFVGVDPFYDMLDEMDSLEDAVDEFDELSRVLVDFLHEGNVAEYKQCRDTIEQLTILMRGIYVDLLKK